MSKTVFSIIQSLLKSWMTFEKASHEFPSSHEIPFWLAIKTSLVKSGNLLYGRKVGKLLLTVLFPCSDILPVISQQNNVILHFSAPPCTWKTWLKILLWIF